MPFKLPTFKQRTAVIGRTGSGKTQFGAWLLSEAPFDRQPYVIVDYKRDELLNGTDRIREIGLKEVPKYPGLYIVHPHPMEEDAVENWLWKVWERERVGLYFDEAYVVPDKGAVRAILTQGRSKRIPTISLSQRPAQVSRFFFSEADFFAVFNLNDDRDQITIAGFSRIPRQPVPLPPFHCRWYDVADDTLVQLSPVPDAGSILDRLDSRLSPRRKVR